MAQLDHNRMMTLDEAADFVALSARTLRRKIEDGELVAHRFGRIWRIAEKDLLTFIEGRHSARRPSSVMAMSCGPTHRKGRANDRPHHSTDHQIRGLAGD